MAHSATYTVSTQGSDKNPGTAQSPWRTIQKAANTAVAGDTVLVHPGIYAERVVIQNSGTSGNPITFEGTRGSGGSWDTIIDGSDATSGWTRAPEVGTGVWKASLGSPQTMMSNGKTIWRISDSSMGDGSGNTNLAQSATAQASTAHGTVLYWDGIEALFGNRSGTTYLRFRNGNDPATMNVRSAPSGGVLTVSGKNYITIKNFKIIGGQFAVRVTGGSQNTIIEENYLTNGRVRVMLDGPGGVSTIIRNNMITLDALGMVAFTPGDRNDTPYGRIVNRHMYDLNKFLIGNTETDDSSIIVAGGSSNTTVSGNVIFNGMMGLTFYQSTTSTTIINNTFHNFSDIGIYVNSDYASATITGNLFYDSDHHMRLEATHRDMDLYIYANRFHEPWYNSSGGGGKHVFVAPPRGGGASPSNIWVYQNSFAGGGWAVDMGGADEFSFHFPRLHVLNNLISTNGISSGGTGPIGEVASNYLDKLWYSNTMPNFVLPDGHKALDSGVDLISRGLPGMATTYYQDGRPDIGALQGTSQSAMPPPHNLRTTNK
jgi:parallel beta-helix repeat protein